VSVDTSQNIIGADEGSMRASGMIGRASTGAPARRPRSSGRGEDQSGPPSSPGPIGSGSMSASICETGAQPALCEDDSQLLSAIPREHILPHLSAGGAWHTRRRLDSHLSWSAPCRCPHRGIPSTNTLQAPCMSHEPKVNTSLLPQVLNHGRALAQGGTWGNVPCTPWLSDCWAGVCPHIC